MDKVEVWIRGLKMKISEGQKAQMRKVDNILLAKIKSRTNFEINEIQTREIREIEDKLGIKCVRPKIHFEWEYGEKLGWQNDHLKFVDENELSQRELKIDRELSDLGI
jgi:hypothetical protein